MVLKLNKNLYPRLCQAPQNWVMHLKSNSGKAGFKPDTDVNPCLYILDKVICLAYVDDCILLASEMSNIEEALHKLKSLKMELEEEDNPYQVDLQSCEAHTKGAHTANYQCTPSQ